MVNTSLPSLDNYHFKAFGSLSVLRRFLTTESPLKMMKNVFRFILKALFILEIFKFLSCLFEYIEKRLDKQAKVNFKISDITKWTTNKYNTLIAQ